MATGLVYLHKVPKALISHVEWTIAGVCGTAVSISWHPDLEESGSMAVVSWSGDIQAGAVLASAFMNLKTITFEVTQDSINGEVGHRWSFLPELGMFQSAVDAAGNILVSENQIRSALLRAGENSLRIQAEIRKLLGQAWDDELEIYRERALAIGSEGNYGVVSSEAERIAYRQHVRPL